MSGGTRTFEVDPPGAVGYEVGPVNQTFSPSASLGYLIKFASGEFGGRVGGLGFVACWVLCTAGCGASAALVFFYLNRTG